MPYLIICRFCTLFGLKGGLGQEKMPLMPFSEADVTLNCERKIRVFLEVCYPGAPGLDNVSEMPMSLPFNLQILGQCLL